MVGRGNSVKDSRGEDTERRERSRRNLADKKRMWATWPDHLGATAVAKVEGDFLHLPYRGRWAGILHLLLFILLFFKLIIFYGDIG